MTDCSNWRLYIRSTETMLLTLIKWSLEHIGYKLLTLFYCDIMNIFGIISKDYLCVQEYSSVNWLGGLENCLGILQSFAA